MTRKTMLLLLILTNCVFPLKGVCTQTNNIQKNVEQPVQQSIDTRQKTQEEQESWRLEKEKLITRFEQLQKEQAQLQDKQAQLQEQVTATNNRLSAKQKQLAHIQQISSQIQPFLNDLVKQLKLHIENNLPFLMDERSRRIEKLEILMTDRKVDASEKYRKVMEALLIETEYGFTIETYQETISVEGNSLLADIFRLGRIGLYYQSLDLKQVGFYNVATLRWESLPATYNAAIHTAIDIAAKRQPVELLSLPLGRLVIQ